MLDVPFDAEDSFTVRKDMAGKADLVVVCIDPDGDQEVDVGVEAYIAFSAGAIVLTVTIDGCNLDDMPRVYVSIHTSFVDLTDVNDTQRARVLAREILRALVDEELHGDTDESVGRSHQE